MTQTPGAHLLGSIYLCTSFQLSFSALSCFPSNNLLNALIPVQKANADRYRMSHDTTNLLFIIEHRVCFYTIGNNSLVRMRTFLCFICTKVRLVIFSSCRTIRPFLPRKRHSLVFSKKSVKLSIVKLALDVLRSQSISWRQIADTRV